MNKIVTFTNTNYFYNTKVLDKKFYQVKIIEVRPKHWQIFQYQ